MKNFNNKFLYIGIILFVIFLLGILGFIYKDDIIKYNSNRIEHNKINKLKEEFKENVIKSGYTFVDLSNNNKLEKSNFDLIQENKCTELIKNIISENTSYSYGAYKDFECKKINKNLVSYKGIIAIQRDNLNLLEKKDISFILYKTKNGVIKKLSKDYIYKKNLGKDLLILEKNKYDGIYFLTDSTKGNNGIFPIFPKIDEKIDLEKIQIYNSGTIAEITLLEKNSSFSKKIIFDKEKLTKKIENLGQVSCEKNGKCKDELKNILKQIRVEKDFFGGTLIGNIQKNKVKKVIINLEKNPECELDLSPYTLTKFSPGSGEFRYNFALKWKNICQNSGAKFSIDLIGKDNKKYTINSNISGPFYDDKYKNLKFIKDKKVSFSSKKSDSYKLDDLIKIGYKDFIITYEGYYLLGKKHKYLYSLKYEIPFGGFDFQYLILDDKITDFNSLYDYICDGKGPKEVYINQGIGRCKKIISLEENNFSYYNSIYKFLITKNIIRGNDLLEVIPDEFEGVDYEEYNEAFKKIDLLGVKDLYLKNDKYYVIGKYNLMIPVKLAIKGAYSFEIKNKNSKDKLYLKNTGDYVIKIKNNKNLNKIGKVGNLNIYEDKNSGCLYLPFEQNKDFGLQYDFYSKNLQINFLDGKNYGDYTFRFAGNTSEIYDQGTKKCYYKIDEKDLEPDKRLVKFGDYLGYPIYKFKNDNDPYLKRRFREQYGVKRGAEKGERYTQYVKSLPVLYWHDPFERWLRVIKMEYIPQAEKMKPIIYLYPEKTTKINVKVKPNGGFKLTIPKYPIGQGWDVIANPNSEIIYKNKKYPYLFWEGKAIGYKMGTKGFIIENNRSSIEKFLEKKLTLLGLNKKEIGDFNSYWIDKLSLVKEKYIFITFASKKQQDLDSPLYITHKPDTIIRVFMDYRGTNNKEKVDELKIITPKRKGFTVVEWGGAKRW